ncbi:reelin domain-containing protein 1-like [Corticium candelabrum]|uniref:reelin domain-containing protein 1-like n=1 Tax=Corticium candelabrum TaxID=121492 RepID=UPI002E269338|nr:reelin domain-containing protein 1-like [Corticium candelabrum]
MAKLCCYTFFIVWLNYVGIVAGYPSGAPSDHCTDMTPVNPPHGNRQPSSSPYRIISDAYSNGYVPGQTYNVSIEKISSASPNFRGFLCQVRQVDQTDAVGTLTPKDLSMSKTLDCTSSQDAVTHSNNNDKQQQAFYWKAPNLGVGTRLEIVCTIVQNVSILWVQQKSEQFKETAVLISTTRQPTTSVPATERMDVGEEVGTATPTVIILKGTTDPHTQEVESSTNARSAAAVIPTSSTPSSQVRSTTSNRATTILPTTKVSSSSSSLIATVRLVSQQPTTTTTTVMSASAGRQDTNLSGSQVSVVPTKQTASSPTTADGTSGAAHASPLILLLVCFLAIIILLL